MASVKRVSIGISALKNQTRFIESVYNVTLKYISQTEQNKKNITYITDICIFCKEYYFKNIFITRYGSGLSDLKDWTTL